MAEHHGVGVTPVIGRERPGDALTAPGPPVGTLLLPVHAPWSTVGDLIDYLREVAPRDAYAVHDGALTTSAPPWLRAFSASVVPELPPATTG
ncbi:hypothetical protein [Streptomyces avermitilis]|uniref:hypothetical protein n=1 Tax=Streptomyces avermitilis TaxID=33903 RepID=UPI0038233EE1